MTNYSSKKVRCKNCNKVGHYSKDCPEPITSFGIICVQVNDTTAHKLKNTSYIVDINTYSKTMLSNNALDLKVLMVQRKHSLGFMDFMRGKYDPFNVTQLIQMFQYMSSEEIKMLGYMSFDELWTDLWKERAFWRQYLEEYRASKSKYNLLVSKEFSTKVTPLLYYVNNVTPSYLIPEWGFPKGRRSCKESEIDCAKREFQEETGYTESDYTLLHNVLPITELFHGTDGILYKHIYYVAILNDNNKQARILPNNKEIGNIGWCSYTDAVTLIRPYHIQKRCVLTQVFNFVDQVK